MDTVEHYVKLTEVIAERATCDRGRSGCIIVRHDIILSTGWVDSPRGTPSCDSEGHLLVNGHCVRTIHAEQNAIARAARKGVSLEGSTLICTMTPCPTCARMIIESGINSVLAIHRYKDPDMSIQMLRSAGVELVHLNNEEVVY